MDRKQALKQALAMLSLGMWAISLFMVPFDESGYSVTTSGTPGNVVVTTEKATGPPGWMVLLLVCTLGVVYVIGIPWVALNIGLLYLAAANLLESRGSKLWGTLYLTLLGLSLLWLVVEQYVFLSPVAGRPRLGAFVWTLACVLVGITTLIGDPGRQRAFSDPCQESRRSGVYRQ